MIDNKFKHMKQINYIFILAVLLIASSCSDSFLDNDPENKSTEDKFYQTDAQMFAALIAAYDPLQWGGIGGSCVPFSEIRSDNMKTGGGGEGDQPDVQALEAYTNNSVATLTRVSPTNASKRSCKW